MRIRSIKPEFWRSPDVADLSIEDRLLWIGLWSYVDDNGAGKDQAPLIAADLFAFDLSRDAPETLARVSRGLQNLSEADRITRYTVNSDSYLCINNWSAHQRIDKPNKARYPLPTCDDAEIRETLARPSRHPRETPAPGTEEQGNRGTEEQGNSQLANARPDVDELCAHLADRIESNGSKRPTITKAWRDAARLMLDRDERPHDEAMRLIDWSQSSDFWQSNILSMTKFRQKYDTLRLQANRAPTTGPNGVPLDRGAQIILAERQQRLQREAQQQQEGEQPWLIER